MMMDANEISKQSFQLNFNSVDSNIHFIQISSKGSQLWRKKKRTKQMQKKELIMIWIVLGK